MLQAKHIINISCSIYVTVKIKPFPVHQNVQNGFSTIAFIPVSMSAFNFCGIERAKLQFMLLLSLGLFALVRAEDDECDVPKYVECAELVHDTIFEHKNGLFQEEKDLAKSCPIIKAGIICIQKYAKDCSTEKIPENYKEKIGKPAEFLTMICDENSPMQAEYVRVSPCLRTNVDDLEICFVKVQEFLAYQEVDTEEKKITMICMYDMMLRGCLLSTGAQKCGMEAAGFIRKALNYVTSFGLQACSRQ